LAADGEADANTSAPKAGATALGCSFFTVEVVESFGTDEVARGRADKPLSAVWVIAGFAHWIIGYDINYERNRPIVDELVRLTGAEDGERLRLDVEIPPNTSATVPVAGKELTVKGAGTERMKGGGVEIPSGRHVIEAE
jgi:hypothetical protein